MKIEHNVQLKNTPEYASVLRAVRLDKGIGQEELAKQLGITPMGLSHYERGERVPNLDRLEQWAQLLGYEVSLKIVLIS